MWKVPFKFCNYFWDSWLTILEAIKRAHNVRFKSLKKHDKESFCSVLIPEIDYVQSLGSMLTNALPYHLQSSHECLQIFNGFHDNIDCLSSCQVKVGYFYTAQIFSGWKNESIFFRHHSITVGNVQYYWLTLT